MVVVTAGWRRAFCTSIPKEVDPEVSPTAEAEAEAVKHYNNDRNNTTDGTSNSNSKSTTSTSGRSPRLFSSRFNSFFSSSPSPSCSTTPRLHNNTRPPPPITNILLSCRTSDDTTSTPPHISLSTTTTTPRSPPTATLRCRIVKTPRSFFSRSPHTNSNSNSNPNPSSPATSSSTPRSPFPLSIFKSNFRLSSLSTSTSTALFSSSSKAKTSSGNNNIIIISCAICSPTSSTKQQQGQVHGHGHGGTAVYTAECSHSFHLSCLSRRVLVGKNGRIICPVCGIRWKEPPPISFSSKEPKLRVYNDDEPLMSPASGGRFNSIPEADDENGDDFSESCQSEYYPGFFSTSSRDNIVDFKEVEVKVSPDAAVIALDRRYQTYTAVLKVRAPPPLANSARRAPIDLVVAIDVGGDVMMSSRQHQHQAVRRAMRLVISALSSSDRLSIVAFSRTSKRILPLRRMTSSGRRSARRIVDALIVSAGGGGASCVSDALWKAAKVLEDRREQNPVASLLLLSSEDDPGRHRSPPLLSSTRYAHTGIPLHFLSLGGGGGEGQGGGQMSTEEKRIRRLVNVVASDLRLQLGFAAGSAAAEISAAYSFSGRPSMLSSGSPKLGDVYAEEEREILLELRVPASAVGSHQILAVRSCYRDPLTRKTVCGKEHAITVPLPHGVRSSSEIQQLRSLFLVTRAVAESRRLAERRRDLGGAYHLLTSARALLAAQPSSSSSSSELMRMVEAEIAENEQRRRQSQIKTDEKWEQLTPTSAWKAAERLAKVAVTRKSMNRVSDLHGFENARF